jgi:hypothetical protein
MSMHHSPEHTGPSRRRGPSVDLDPHGIVTGKSPDRQRRQLLNYSFYRLDPVFRRLPADEQRVAADGFTDLAGRLRLTKASHDTQRDTPMFACAKAPIDAILAQLANTD